ncbi:MAG: rhodanese-like domain-containing protein [Propionibacteriaceae bacterium]|jgi:rhodanese-related sulfurtransferase|nr:rhodanese-like domain-containing protein [Propionibacteriaceae bacterium]
MPFITKPRRERRSAAIRVRNLAGLGDPATPQAAQTAPREVVEATQLPAPASDLVPSALPPSDPAGASGTGWAREGGQTTGETGSALVWTITARQLADRLAAGQHIQLIDVREPHERAAARFPNAKSVPLGQLYRRVDELDPATAAVFICKAGQRSLTAIGLLAEAGYTGPMLSLYQGIEAWARDVDNTLLPALAA